MKKRLLIIVASCTLALGSAAVPAQAAQDGFFDGNGAQTALGFFDGK